MRKIMMMVLMVFVVALVSAGNALAYCEGGFPHFFYGDLKIDGADAPIGTQVRGLIDGVNYQGSVYTTTVVGQYGSAETADKLAVYGSQEGTDEPPQIVFEVFVAGQWVDSGESATYFCGNPGTLLNIDAPSPSGGPVDTDDDGFDSTVDCNDNDPLVYPGAPEIENGMDDNCNGIIDEGTNAYDDDGDGYSENLGDCNDANPFIYPGAAEECDGIDNDCNALTLDGSDDPDVGSVTSCGVGECFAVGMVQCVGGMLVDSCLPLPPQPEVCDGLDNSCNGLVDDGVLMSFYQDADGDTYGNAAVSVNACVAPSGYVADNTDCDDSNPAVHPGTTEVVNGIDDNCNGVVDETAPADGDGDGYTDDVDCNDENPNVNPGMTEICDNGIDDDCDGHVDGTDSQCFVCTDSDGDGICDDDDACPFDDQNDADGDGVCGDVDICPLGDDNFDPDGDGIPYACDDDELQLYDVGIHIYNGWTLFAMPYQPVGVFDSEEVGQAIISATGMNCDVLLRFDGASQLMEADILGLADTPFGISGTQGYFIHCNGAHAVWNYQGIAWG